MDPAWRPSSTADSGLTPQGWLREWDANQRVSHNLAWPAALETLSQAHASVLSIADVGGDWAVAERWAKASRVLVVTTGPEGCTVFVQGQGTRQFRAPQVEEVDPTGAGDVFATAFLLRYQETGDPLEAAAFGACAASCVVEGLGASRLGDRGEVERRLQERERFLEGDGPEDD